MEAVLREIQDDWRSAEGEARHEDTRNASSKSEGLSSPMSQRRKARSRRQDQSIIQSFLIPLICAFFINYDYVSASLLVSGILETWFWGGDGEQQRAKHFHDKDAN